MFGKNTITKTAGDRKHAIIKEIFFTIQGEGPFSGEPSVFIRMGHCSLACYFCDTEFSHDLQSMSLAEVVINGIAVVPKTLWRKTPKPLCVITGGEPLIQESLPELIYLLSEPFRVQIETAGTNWPATEKQFEDWPNKAFFVVSPKTPKLNENVLQNVGAYKYVVKSEDADPHDGLPILPTQLSQMSRTEKQVKLARPQTVELWRRVYVSPMDEYNEEKNKTNVQHAVKLAMMFGYKLSLQTHKIVNLP